MIRRKHLSKNYITGVYQNSLNSNHWCSLTTQVYFTHQIHFQHIISFSKVPQTISIQKSTI